MAHLKPMIREGLHRGHHQRHRRMGKEDIPPGIAGTEPGKWEKREDVTTVAPEELNNKNLDLL